MSTASTATAAITSNGTTQMTNTRTDSDDVASDHKIGKEETWREKLITKEDYYHHHKTLGIIVAMMMVVRFLYAGQESDMGFKSHPQYTVPTMILHFLLNASSFQFVIPKRRIKNGSRIWPEYRLHAATFALRSIVVILYYYYEEVTHVTQPNYYFNYLAQIGGMLAADLASYSVGAQHQSSSVRDLDTHPAIKFFFSFMQFNANAGIVYGLRRYTLPFSILFVVQTTPFVATLYRKRIFDSDTKIGVFLYGAMLVYCAVFIQFDYIADGNKTFSIIRGSGQIAMLQRMVPLPKSMISNFIQNKYVVWTTNFLLLQYIRSHKDEISESTFKMMWAISFVLCLLLGYYKYIVSLREEKDRPKVKKV